MSWRSDLSIGLVAIITAGSLFGGTREAQAADFIAVIANLANVRKPQAQLDVAIDTRAAPVGTPVVFRVHDADGITRDEPWSHAGPGH